MRPAASLEVGAIYRLLSGRFAILLEQSGDGCLFCAVDVHRACEVPDAQLTLSPSASNRCRLAWHPHQWATRQRERAVVDAHRAADRFRVQQKELIYATAK